MVADFFQGLLLSFIPLFVALDPVGVLPFILTLTQHMEPRERSRAVLYAMLTALAMGLVFIAIGEGVFRLLGITVSEFLVAGGVVLLALSINHLVRGKLVEIEPSVGYESIGVVPLGTPLVAGPAVLTTLLLLTDQFSDQGAVGIAVVVVGFLANLGIAWVVFAQANRVARLLRVGGMSAVSKIASLLLAAIAVKMISQGVQNMLT